MATISCPQCKRLTDDGQRLCPGCKFNIRKYVKDIKKNGGVVSSGLSLGSAYSRETPKMAGGAELEFLSAPAKAPEPEAPAAAPEAAPAPAPAPAVSAAPSASSEVSLGDVFRTTASPKAGNVPPAPYGTSAPASSVVAPAPAAPVYTPAPAYTPAAAPAAPAATEWGIYGKPAPSATSAPIAPYSTPAPASSAPAYTPAPAPAAPAYTPAPAAPAYTPATQATPASSVSPVGSTGGSMYGTAPAAPAPAAPSAAALERQIYGTAPAAPAAPAANEPVFESASLNRSDDLRRKAPTYQPTVGQLPGANNAGRSNPSATSWSASSANPISHISAEQLASIPRTSAGEPLFESASLNYNQTGGGALSGAPSGPTIMEKLRMEREAKEAEASIFETMSLKKEEKALEAGIMQPLGGISGQPDTPMFGEHQKPEDRSIIPRSQYSAMPEGRSAMGGDDRKNRDSMFQSAAAVIPWQAPKTGTQAAPAGYKSPNPSTSYQQPQQQAPGQNTYRPSTPAPAYNAPQTPAYNAPQTPAYNPQTPAYNPQNSGNANPLFGTGAPQPYNPVGGGSSLLGGGTPQAPSPMGGNPLYGGAAPAASGNGLYGSAPAAGGNPFLAGGGANANPYLGGGTGQ